MKLNKDNIYFFFLIFLIMFLFFVLSINVATSYAEDSLAKTLDSSKLITDEEGDICFEVEDAKRLVVELEKGKILEKNLDLLEKSNDELTKQTQLLKEQIDLMNEKINAAQKLIDESEKIYGEKEKVFEEKEVILNDELKEAKKPRWKSIFSAGGIGAAIAAVLISVL